MAQQTKDFVKFKQKNQGNTLMFLHPLISMVMFDMANWCNTRSISFVVTDTISTFKKDKKLGRVSDSHRTRRAFDLRSRTFSKRQAEEFIQYFNNKYSNIASVSASDLVPRLVVHHGKDDSLHFHIAIHSRFRVNY